MLIDVSVPVTKFCERNASENERIASLGHLGRHFVVMDKELQHEGIIFNVKGIYDREINILDIDLTLVKPEMFVVFYKGYIDEVKYHSKEYLSSHPQIDNKLIVELLEKHISIIGVDFEGIRRGEERTTIGQYCADKGVYVTENLYNLDSVVLSKKSKRCTIHTYTNKFAGLSGMPCRVVVAV